MFLCLFLRYRNNLALPYRYYIFLELVEIRFDLKFEFDEVDEDIFTEWYHNDIEQGKEMLNEYLGIENYTEISI